LLADHSSQIDLWGRDHHPDLVLAPVDEQVHVLALTPGDTVKIPDTTTVLMVPKKTAFCS
jgi:hypothetical protein